jgi:putative DNA methylase
MSRRSLQIPLLLEAQPEAWRPRAAQRRTQPSLIEDPSFPFEDLSSIAEAESWRKEISRPPYHLHKWWAQRLGSVFRAIILASVAPPDSNLIDLFFSPLRLPDLIVFDPFMGSGTTIGEALKLGCQVIGRDINPVAVSSAKTALRLPERGRVIAAYRDLEADVAHKLLPYYMAKLVGGRDAHVLYYFWVKHLPCPFCNTDVDLFSSYVFARHAYPKRHPVARALCPRCGTLAETRFDSTRVLCSSCAAEYDPSRGPVRGATATCPACHGAFKIVDAVKKQGRSPDHRLYAKLVIAPDGAKAYLPADDYDYCLYKRAEAALHEHANPYPLVAIPSGHNTSQAIRYGYTYWHEMFNARQLLGINMLADAIRSNCAGELRELFFCLLSGTLEFNNMFASYKGEGTGAVRHLFSHHIFKPERTPLEANLWGTPKSSGAFSTLFRRRLLSAIEYCENPFEIRPRPGTGSEKVFGLSASMHLAGSDAQPLTTRYELSCGDSASTGLPDQHVDIVVTDPPFFDNVHYSELADFFFVWQRHWQKRTSADPTTTRSTAEVQHTGVVEFMTRLRNVWKECHRVLKDDGLLVFTYHHSRYEGWHALLESLAGAGFFVVQVHPVKAEMSVASPKHQSREPIDYDMVFVCRKAHERATGTADAQTVADEALQRATIQVRRLLKRGRHVGPGDVRAILHAQIVADLSRRELTRDTQKMFEAASSIVVLRAQHVLHENLS